MRDQTQTQLSIRLPSEHIEALECLAREEDRTITAEIRRLVRLHLVEKGRVPA